MTITTNRFRVTTCDAKTGEPQTSDEFCMERDYEWHDDRPNQAIAERVAEAWANEDVEPEFFRHYDSKVTYKLTVSPWEVSDAREAVRVIVEVQLKFITDGNSKVTDEAWARPA